MTEITKILATYVAPTFRFITYRADVSGNAPWNPDDSICLAALCRAGGVKADSTLYHAAHDRCDLALAAEAASRPCFFLDRIAATVGDAGSGPSMGIPRPFALIFDDTHARQFAASEALPVVPAALAAAEMTGRIRAVATSCGNRSRVRGLFAVLHAALIRHRIMRAAFFIPQPPPAHIWPRPPAWPGKTLSAWIATGIASAFRVWRRQARRQDHCNPGPMADMGTSAIRWGGPQ